ncbi:MAG TPA: tetratricopeptide repeat protein [Chthoniobacterales bacterium]
MLAGAGAAGFHFYKQWRSHRWVNRAEAFLAVGDTKSASFVALNILQLDSRNIEAYRLLARVAEQDGVRSAIDWRQRVAREAPDSIPDTIALARTAVRFGEIKTAQAAIDRIPAIGQRDAGYHEVMAQLAMAQKDPASAVRHYTEAAQLDPGNKNYKLSLAIAQLSSPDAAARVEAHALLRKLMDDRDVRLPAARAFLEDAIQRKDPELVPVASLLSSFPEATFGDRLRRLQILSQLRLPEYPAVLTQVQDEALSDPAKLTEMLVSMSENNQALLAIEWIRRIPAAKLEQRPVFVAAADCFIAISDCTGLEEWAKRFNWKDLEYLRHAYLARAFRDCNKPLDFDLEWSKAFKGAVNNEAVQTLQKAAAKWGWKKESIDLLWLLTKDPGSQRAALTTLNQYYTESSDTPSLYRVASRLAQIAPDDTRAQNNFAQLSLLLNVNTERAGEIARQLHEHDPRDPDLACGYAFALYAKGNWREALNVMNTLSEEDRHRPEIAAYHGLILMAAGQKEKAALYLELGSQAKLLPQEKALLEKAFSSGR